jgi:hypothetical protein
MRNFGLMSGQSKVWKIPQRGRAHKKRRTLGLRPGRRFQEPSPACEMTSKVSAASCGGIVRSESGRAHEGAPLNRGGPAIGPQQFARELGMSRVTLWNVLTGKRPITLLMRKRIRSSLGFNFVRPEGRESDVKRPPAIGVEGKGKVSAKVESGKGHGPIGGGGTRAL